jgi:hypothetical protein
LSGCHKSRIGVVSLIALALHNHADFKTASE